MAPEGEGMLVVRDALRVVWDWGATFPWDLLKMSLVIARGWTG